MVWTRAGREMCRRSPPGGHGGAQPKRGTVSTNAPPFLPGGPHSNNTWACRPAETETCRYLPKQPCPMRTCVIRNVRTPWRFSSHPSKRGLTATIATCSPLGCDTCRCFHTAMRLRWSSVRRAAICCGSGVLPRKRRLAPPVHVGERFRLQTRNSSKHFQFVLQIHYLTLPGKRLLGPSRHSWTYCTFSPYVYARFGAVGHEFHLRQVHLQCNLNTCIAKVL